LSTSIRVGALLRGQRYLLDVDLCHGRENRVQGMSGEGLVLEQGAAVS
jgi:hypothetical protein